MPHPSQLDPRPWIGLFTLLADPILPDPHFLLMLPEANNNELLSQLLNVLAGNRVFFTHNRRYYNVLQGGMDVVSFLSEGLRCITWNTRGLVGSNFSRQRNRESKLNCFKKLLDHNNIICLQEVHGQDEFLQAIQVLAPHIFGSLVLFFLITKMREDRLDLLSEEAIVTHVVTCQGRDHLCKHSIWTITTWLLSTSVLNLNLP